MKFTQIAIASVSLIAMLTGKVNAVQSAPVLQSVAPHATKIAQAQPDLELLAKTVTNFFQSDSYLTESQSLLTAKITSLDLAFNINTKTIVKAGGKFRSEITFVQPGESPSSTNLLISDGKQVWIYRPDLKQYAVTSYQNFQKKYDESFFIGISSLMFLEIPEKDRKLIAETGNSGDILKEFGLSNIKGIKQENSTVDGENLSVYNYTFKKEGFNVAGFIKPETAILKQLQIGGKTQGMNMLITEKILARTPSPRIDAKTFNFTPPPGVKKVTSLSITPF